jgi:hypothetical protein
MKKSILLTGVLYLFLLISCKAPNERLKSFSDIIQDDPSRIPELLRVADSLKTLNDVKLDPHPTNEIGEKTRDSLRKNKTNFKNKPVIKVSILEMQSIINKLQKDKCDTLAFLLGSYRSDADIARYNERNASTEKKYTKKDLRKRPTFVISGQKTMKPKNQMLSLSELTFDASRICPPPPGDCY